MRIGARKLVILFVITQAWCAVSYGEDCQNCTIDGPPAAAPVKTSKSAAKSNASDYCLAQADAYIHQKEALEDIEHHQKDVQKKVDDLKREEKTLRGAATALENAAGATPPPKNADDLKKQATGKNSAADAKKRERESLEKIGDASKGEKDGDKVALDKQAAANKEALALAKAPFEPVGDKEPQCDPSLIEGDHAEEAGGSGGGGGGGGGSEGGAPQTASAPPAGGGDDGGGEEDGEGEGEGDDTAAKLAAQKAKADADREANKNAALAANKSSEPPKFETLQPPTDPEAGATPPTDTGKSARAIAAAKQLEFSRQVLDLQKADLQTITPRVQVVQATEDKSNTMLEAFTNGKGATPTKIPGNFRFPGGESLPLARNSQDVQNNAFTSKKPSNRKKLSPVGASVGGRKQVKFAEGEAVQQPVRGIASVSGHATSAKAENLLQSVRATYVKQTTNH